MSSSLLHDRILFSCIYPDKPTFSVVPCVFSSTCFAQNLQPTLDKLEPRAIKCVFVDYSPQKGYRCFDHIHCEFYTYADVTFFESLSYFTPMVSSPIPQSMSSSGDLEKDIVRKLLQVYTKCFKDVVSTSLRADLESITTNLDPPHSASLPTDPSLSTAEMDTSASFDLNLPIAHRKGKRPCILHPISNYISYDRLTPLSRQFAISVSFVFIPKSYQEALMFPE